MNKLTADNFERWNYSVHAVCGNFLTHPSDRINTFIGNIQHHDLGGLNLADIRVNASSIRRERGNADRGDDRYYFLVLQRAGQMEVVHHDKSFSLNPGDMALLDSAQPFEMQPKGLISQLSIHLERDAVDRFLPVYSCRFGKLQQSSLSGRLLHGMLQQMIEGKTSVKVDNQHGEALQDALISLLCPSLRMNGTTKNCSPLFQLAEQLINESLLDPPSPAEIAARLNVSVRHLYRHFELNGVSIGRYIQRQRLRCSARELAQIGNTSTTITTIAYKWGFSDSAHFSRAFKRQYGMTPRDYCARNKDIHEAAISSSNQNMIEDL